MPTALPTAEIPMSSDYFVFFLSFGRRGYLVKCEYFSIVTILHFVSYLVYHLFTYIAHTSVCRTRKKKGDTNR